MVDRDEHGAVAKWGLGRLTNPGIAVLLIFVATGGALLLFAIVLASKISATEFDHIKTVAEFVAVAAGIPAAVFALFNYAVDVTERKRAELWRRRQYVDERFSRFEANVKVAAVMTMLDYWDREVLLPGADKPVMIKNELLTSALAPGATKLVDTQVLIRDAFDEFFDGMDRLGVMLDAGLVSREDLLPYVGYWLRLLDSAPRKRNSEFGPVVRTYIRKYNFDALERLMAAADVRVFSEEDKAIAHDYAVSLKNRETGS